MSQLDFFEVLTVTVNKILHSVESRRKCIHTAERHHIQRSNRKSITLQIEHSCDPALSLLIVFIMSNPPHAPMFATDVPYLSVQASQALAQRGTPATLNLDDIFGDVFFTPDGDTVFMSEQQEKEEVLPSGEKNVSSVASKPQGHTYVPVPQAGGLHTTNLDRPGERALAMGVSGTAAPTPAVPFQQPPQQSHHMQFAMPNAPLAPQPAAQKKRSRSTTSTSSTRSAERKMSEQQKVERRYV